MSSPERGLLQHQVCPEVGEDGVFYCPVLPLCSEQGRKDGIQQAAGVCLHLMGRKCMAGS